MAAQAQSEMATPIAGGMARASGAIARDGWDDWDGWDGNNGELAEALGLFGPDSMAWKFSGQSLLALGGARAILLQLAHPLVAAGVGDHSAYRHDPWGRASATMDLIYRVAFGSRSEALGALRLINTLHRSVTGALDQDAGAIPAGTPYHARDPQLLLWVYATLLDTFYYLQPLLIGPLSQADREAYYTEAKLAMRLFAIPAAIIPPTLDDFTAYWDGMLAGETLVVIPAAQEVARTILHMPMPVVLRPLWRATDVMTIGMLPPRIRDLYGFRWNRHWQALYDGWALSVRRVIAPLLPEPLRLLPPVRAARYRVAAAQRTAHA